METKPLTREEILSSDPFRDPDDRFGQLDLPPDYAARGKEATFTDDRFAPLVDDTKGLPERMAEFFSQRGNDDGEIRRLTGADTHDSGVFFVNGQPVKWAQKSGKFYAVVALDRSTDPPRQMKYQADSYEALCSLVATRATGRPWRELSQSQTLECARLAASGHIGPAIQRYLSLALDGTGVTPEQVIKDSKYAKLCDECAWFVFENATPDYSPSEQGRRFIEEYCGDRPLNVGLLQVAYKAYRRSLLFPESPENGNWQPDEAPTYRDLDDLDDTALDSLRVAVMRERAASGRR